MKLVLTGGGDSENFEEIDKHFINMLGDKRTLLFIPLAGDEDTWDDGLERIHEVFSTIHFDAIEMCVDLSVLDWDYLSNFSAIYIDGGNTFRLMDEIHNTHTYELLHRFLHNGGIINGDSAGAIVLGSHIETAHFGEMGDENESDVISYQGLNLIGNWAVHCHYDEKEDEEIMEFSKDYGFPIIALHENSAIAIDNKMLFVIGENKISIFMGDKKINVPPGQTYLVV